MDVCLITAQLLAACLAQESQPALPPDPSTDVLIANPTVAPQPSTGARAITPESPPLMPSRSSGGNPAAPAQAMAATRARLAESRATTALSLIPAVDTPSHPVALIRARRPRPTAAPLPIPNHSDRQGPQPQLSRLTPPSAVALPYWAQAPRPVSGSQMYQFRLASLRAGELFTRATPHHYLSQWQTATTPPTQQDWQALLQREAAVMAEAQGPNRLTVILGDSLTQWLPSEPLPRDRFWLNQGISGETTAHILGRLHYFADTRPETIHIMAGINDLKQGATDSEVLINLLRILSTLRQQHPQAQLVVHSLLPTRWDQLPSHRIRRVNLHLAQLARQQGALFVDLQPTFSDAQGQLRRELTTDGLHLSYQGYEAWRPTLLNY